MLPSATGAAFTYAHANAPCIPLQCCRRGVHQEDSSHVGGRVLGRQLGISLRNRVIDPKMGRCFRNGSSLHGRRKFLLRESSDCLKEIQFSTLGFCSETASQDGVDTSFLEGNQFLGFNVTWIFFGYFFFFSFAYIRPCYTLWHGRLIITNLYMYCPLTVLPGPLQWAVSIWLAVEDQVFATTPLWRGSQTPTSTPGGSPGGLPSRNLESPPVRGGLSRWGGTYIGLDCLFETQFLHDGFFVPEWLPRHGVTKVSLKRILGFSIRDLVYLCWGVVSECRPVMEQRTLH